MTENHLDEKYKGFTIKVRPFLFKFFCWTVNKKSGIATTLDNAAIQAKRYIDNLDKIKISGFKKE